MGQEKEGGQHICQDVDKVSKDGERRADLRSCRERENMWMVSGEGEQELREIVLECEDGKRMERAGEETFVFNPCLSWIIWEEAEKMQYVKSDFTGAQRNEQVNKY